MDRLTSMHFTVAWLGWLWMFAVVETAALAAGHGTLSAHVWRWFGIERTPYTVEWWALPATVAVAALVIGDWRAAVIAAFLAWLATHFLTGGAI